MLSRGKRTENGLWPNQSSRGGLPLGSFIQRTNFDGETTPTVQVMPPITTFERRTPLSAP